MMDERPMQPAVACERIEKTLACVAEVIEGAHALLETLSEDGALSRKDQAALGTIQCALAWCVHELDEIAEEPLATLAQNRA